MNNATAFEYSLKAEYPRMMWYWTQWGWRAVVPRVVGARELDPENERFMYAVNSASRLRFGKIAHTHLTRRLSGTSAEPAGHWITLAPSKYFLPLPTAHQFNPNSLRAWVRQALHGLNYLAMIEVAYFERRTALKTYRFASWHVHLVEWGSSTEEISRRVEEINERDRAEVPGQTVAHFIPFVRAAALIRRVFYMMKSPRSRYRIRNRPLLRRDPATGLPREDWVAKDRIYPKQITWLYDVMGDRLLDDLLIGGGEGAELAKAIRDEALGGLPKWVRNGERPPAANSR